MCHMKSNIELFQRPFPTVMLLITINLLTVESFENSPQDIVDVLRSVEEIEPSQTIQESKSDILEFTAEVGKLFEYSASTHLGKESNLTSIAVSIHN